MYKEGFIICDNEMKEQILRNLDTFKNYMFLSYSELKQKLYFTVDKKAIFLIMKHYNVSYFMAKEYIDGVKLIENKEYNIPKLDSLVSIYNFLVQNNLIIKDKYFINRLKKFPVTFINPNKNEEYFKIKTDLLEYTNVYEIDSLSDVLYTPVVYEFNDILSESRFIFNKIIDLVNGGISLNKIFIIKNNEYDFMFRRLARNYNISFNFNNNENILSSNIIKDFINGCYQYDTFNELLETINTGDKLYGKIIDVINNYGLAKYKPIECIDILTNIFKEVKYPNIRYVEGISFITNKTIIKDDEYVFYPGFNLGGVPTVYKEDAFLGDKLLDVLKSTPSYIKNKNEKESVINFITKNKNVIITYKKSLGVNKCDPSILIKELNLKVEEGNVEIGYNKIEDDLMLTSCYDSFLKYNEQSSLLDEYGIQDIKYNTFDNKFKGIKQEKLNKFFVDKPLSLSYSSMSVYYKCPFAFYLKRILKIDEFESNMGTRLGTYAHAVLERSYLPDFVFEEVVDEEINKNAIDAKDEFYFNRIKNLLANTIAFNQEHEEVTPFVNHELEKNVKLDFDDFHFEGYIDKVLYYIDGDDAYAVIIDYKTGSSDLATLDNIEHGINLQLPIYMLLLKNNELFINKKLHIVGFYLQKLQILLFNDKKDIDSQIKDSIKLQGYTNSDIKLMRMIDPNFSDSDYIKSLKMTGSGFYQYAKLITDDEQQEVMKLTEQLINDAGKSILKGVFPITEKKLDGKEHSCKYCSFKDVCYVKDNDIVELETIKFKKENK